MQNTRNLGSYRVSDGILTGYESILRSNIQNCPSEEDFEYLISKNITTIIDMRGQKMLIESQAVLLVKMALNITISR